MIKPTVGRVLHFHPNGLPGDGEQPRAAIVAHVWGDRMINIAYFDANGVVGRATSVTLLQPEDKLTDSIANHPYCEWMSYQMGQAAKAEALQSELDHKGTE